jgi:pyridoxine/pyridoxamine 5'-phosphate oxidase
MTETPFTCFDDWFVQAKTTEPNDPNAMALASVSADGQPSVRMVLLKGHDPRGFVFYTNFEGRKAGELIAHPKVALLFHWKSARRQIRIEGSVRRSRCLFCDTWPGFAAWRLGIGSIPPARRAGDISGAVRRCSGTI